jgi:hypothetical protein
MSQLHKKFTTEQVKDLLQRYIDKKIERKYIQKILHIKKRQFFKLLKEYRTDPGKFSIDYSRKSPNRISPEVEVNILKEFKIDKKIIQNKNNPTDSYNYSYIKDRLEIKHHQKVSLLKRRKKSSRP